jgi:hypothetical protein
VTPYTPQPALHHQQSPFAAAWQQYRAAGWPGVLWLPPGQKAPPPSAHTGEDGVQPSDAVLAAVAAQAPAGNIALRLPRDGGLCIVGIDVDHYDKIKALPDGSRHVVQKRGGDLLAQLEGQLGPLPPTWRSSARPLPSGIRFYRVPAGRYRTTIGDAIEIVQWHHRYAVVWPSTNPEAGGGQYQWSHGHPGVDQLVQQALAAGNPPVPQPGELAELPPAWVEYLRSGATEAGPAMAGHAAGEVMLAGIVGDTRPPCAEVYNAAARGFAELEAAAAGSRHDVATARVHHLVQLGAHGHVGVGEALIGLEAVFEKLTAGEDRGDEWRRLMTTSARKAVTAIGGDRPAPGDPCVMVGTGRPVPTPAELFAGVRVLGVIDWPAADGGAVAGQLSTVDELALPDPADPPFSTRMLTGAEAFDPTCDLDQMLAHEVLGRMHPVLRYAVDSGTWLVHAGTRWKERGDLAGWAVSHLAELMPRGDAEAEKGSREFNRAARRRRFMSSGPAGGISKKIRDAVANDHINTLELAELDIEPHILWAGGLPWDLRRSGEQPVVADLDPTTPHLHSALLAPDPRYPTPRWDAFTAAVWPDPEVREWALQVLAVTLTGDARSVKVLPILLGPRHRGKTAIIEVLSHLLGTYAHSADPRLLASGDNAHASIIYALKGRRLSFVDEGPREGRWAIEQLKRLTGAGRLTGNAMRANPVTFISTHTLVLTANDDPHLVDEALRGRVRLVPCHGELDEVREARTAIGDLAGAEWRREVPGVLAAMMRRAARWLADDRVATVAAAPIEIRGRADELAAEQDPVAGWVEDETEPYEPGMPAGRLYQSFVDWCRRSNIRNVPTATLWGRSLTTLGHHKRHTSSGKVRPLRLRMPGYNPPAGPVTPSGHEGVIGDQLPLITTSLDSSGDHLGDQTIPQVVTQVVTPQNPTSSAVLPSAVTTVTTSTGPLPLSTKNTLKTQKIRENRGFAEVVTEAAPPAGAFSAEISEKLIKARSQAPPGEVSPKVNTAGLSRTAAAKARKEAEKAARVAELSGPTIGLPALETRGTACPAPLALAAAGEHLRTICALGRPLTVDVEHTGYPIGHRLHRLRTIQLGDAYTTVVLDADDPPQRALARHWLLAAERLTAHSASADLVPLEHAGVLTSEEADQCWAKTSDTAIRALLSDPELTGEEGGLKAVAARVLGDTAVSPPADAARTALFKAAGWLVKTKLDTPLEKSGWAQVDPGCATMVRYGASDVLDTAHLDGVLPALHPDQAAREHRVQQITSRITRRGVRLDEAHARTMLAEHEASLAESAGRLRQLGISTPGSKAEEVARLAQLGVSVPYTAKGNPSVAEHVLTPLRATEGEIGALAAAILDHREKVTGRGLFLDPYLQRCELGDGRAYPTIYTLGTKTGRMSCTRPNFQQLPRVGGYRACLVAEPGWTWITADFSGVEIRVAAALSQDPNLIRMVLEGEDLHWNVARMVWGREATKAQRYKAKPIVFGRFYQGGAETLAQQAGVTVTEAHMVIDALDTLAPGLRAWSKDLSAAARQGNTLYPSYAGRVIHLPTVRHYAAANYAIQGTARELLIDGLLNWDDSEYGRGRTVLPIHDEIATMVPIEQAEAATAELVRCMTTSLHGIPITVAASTPTVALADAA